MTNENNVIAFPKQNNRAPNLELFRDKMDEAIANGTIHKAHAYEAANLFSTILIEHLTIAGFKVTKESNIKDLALVLEAIKSYMMKHYGLYHPLQTLSEEIFTHKSNGDILLKTSKITKLTTRE